jgi:hypothetical protein
VTEAVAARSKTPGIVALLGEVLLAASALGGLQSCVEARAVSMAPGRIDQVRLGFGLDLEGRVSPGCAASTFSLHDPIHLSIQISDAGAGSSLHVTVRDLATHRIAWSEDRSLTPGRSSLTFEIGKELAVGRYREESSLGGATTSSRDFVVHDRREGVR